MNKIVTKTIIESFTPSIKLVALLFGGFISTPIVLIYFFKFDIWESVWISVFVYLFILMTVFLIRLCSNIDKMVNYYEEEMKKRETVFIKQSSSNTEFPYRFLENAKISKLELNEETMMFDEKSTWKIKAKVESDEISYIRHMLGKGDKYFIDCSSISINTLKSITGHEITIRDDRKDQGMYRWYVCFADVLKKDDVIEYEMEYIVKNKYLLCSNDLTLALNLKQVAQINDNVDFMPRAVYLPCEKLNTKIIFPDKFPLPFMPRINVEKRHIKLTEEIKRISSIFNYDGKEKAGVLNIEKPVVDCSYKIEWKLPSIGELIKVGFITKEQSEKIINRSDFKW